MVADVRGQLVLDDRIVNGRLRIDNGLIASIEDDGTDDGGDGPLITPGYCDVHVHGFGGHDATGAPEDLDGMARALLRRGVTSFLPTAVSAPLDQLTLFAERVRDWLPRAPADGARPLGINLEGPFLAAARRGAHDPAHLRAPADVDFAQLFEPMLPGLRLLTLAPELPGALELAAWLHDRGVVVSAGHSDADLAAGRAGYAAGISSTTHLLNAMRGLDHHAPGLAAAALADDDVYVELIADGHHVDRALWPLVLRAKPPDRLVLVSDAIALAGTDARRGTIGGLQVHVDGDRATLVEGGNLAGSLIALDTAVRNLVAEGTPLPHAVAAASRNPLALLGVSDRGRLAAGQRADLLELDADLNVHRVMAGGDWLVR
jgi:N-acetylglucosamine-6-phosphate deacetylase